MSGDNFETERWGPQPYEGFLSEVCEAFSCTPEEAERQDYQKVIAIFDYRLARTAKQIYQGKDRKEAFKTLRDNPALTRMLAMMKRAQDGRPIHGGEDAKVEGLEIAKDRRNVPEDKPGDKDEDGDPSEPGG